MYNVEINKVPNQELTFIVDGNSFRIQLRTIQELTFASIYLNDEPMLYSQLCVPNEYINGKQYLGKNGMFYFRCLDNEYPNYKKFGDTHHLEYYAENEL